ncbi:Ppx/GppA phosphatase family protein [Stigmatella erecta]|uniref:Exopolyphosphatase / guanosine-5'-triphosphate,3'-diphosphate pyrophosphatase n=1 Tax=Stigmatella erecta TaxID=83460 RepID=A0A1I0HR89_9BACT|nr:exopolyphosphatase [Stigmatella erecta]SET86317.1 exopolyphosphatase / guanosine-5'-triphosphate,3'-diphosphate pyrophosphatase [Stigmatella erecta]
MALATPLPLFAAIDVGTNAARLEMARLGPGGLERVLKEREAIRPGEGVFARGAMSSEAVDRLVDTLRRYAVLCRHHKARVRAVATSALREARNQTKVLRQVREETGLELEVVSGEEEARLICLGVLHRTPPRERSLLVDIGGGSTEIVLATGERPQGLWSLPLGAVRLSQHFDTAGEVTPAQLRRMREDVDARLRECLPGFVPRLPPVALGSSGSIRAVVEFAAREGGEASASPAQLTRAVEALARMSPRERREHFEERRADIIVAGALLLERVVRHLGVERVLAVKRGLRDGVLADLLAREELAARVGTAPWLRRAAGARGD